MKHRVPFRNIFSNDTTNIGSCTSPYHERFGPAGREQVRATVKEVDVFPANQYQPKYRTK